MTKECEARCEIAILYMATSTTKHPLNSSGTFFARRSMWALDLPECRDTLDDVLESMKKVKRNIEKQETEVELLRIQGQFIGNPPIYKPGRRLIIEGELFRVNKDSSNHDKKDKQYKFHLFNDSLCYSRIISTGSYKFTRALNLSSAMIQNLPDR